MTYLWAGMILIGIVYGVITGNQQAVTEAVISSSKEAVMLCVSMAGITAMWTGIMKIAENTGLVAQLSRGMRPILRFLFPQLEPQSKACKYISLNFLANFLGLGWAATPAGLRAMEELARLEDERRREEEYTAAGQKGGRSTGRKISGVKGKVRAAASGVASNDMCTFLILNISSLQLIPVNIIAYRSQYGSPNPTAVVGPGIVATAVSTAAAVVFCKAMERKSRGNN